MRNKAVVAAAALGLAACGGGGSSNSGFDLGSKAGLVDAASVVSGAASFVAEEDDGGGLTAKSESRPASGGRKLARTASASRLQLRPAKSAAPKATSTQNCDSGSTTTETASKNFNFSLFDSQSRTVDFVRETENNCKYTYSNGGVETYTGVAEFGTTSSEEFGYAQFGSGNTPSSYSYMETGYSTSESLLGQVQFRSTSVLDDVRTIATLKSAEADGSDSYKLTASLGQGGAPLKVTSNSNGLLTIDGPVDIESSECPGGKISITTLQPFDLSSTEEGDSYAVGGSVRVQSGNSSVTFTYNADGSATYQTGSGSTGTLSRDELLNGGC